MSRNILRDRWGPSEPFYKEDEDVEYSYVSAFPPMKDKDTYNSIEDIDESNARKIAIAAKQTTATRHRLLNKKKPRPHVITGYITEDDMDDQRATKVKKAVSDNRELEVQEGQVQEEEEEAAVVHEQGELESMASAKAAEDTAEKSADEDVDVNNGSDEEGPDGMTRSQQGVIRSAANMHNEDRDVEEDAEVEEPEFAPDGE